MGSDGLLSVVDDILLIRESANLFKFYRNFERYKILVIFWINSDLRKSQERL